MLEFLPKRSAHEITIDGFAVPCIEAKESADGLTCDISLDRRFGATIRAEDAQSILWLLANALAIGAGYSCHGENSVISNPFKVKVMEVGSKS